LQCNLKEGKKVEFLKQPGIYEIILFSMGVFTYKFVSMAVKYIEMRNLMVNTAESCLQMLNLFYYGFRTMIMLQKEELLKKASVEDAKIVRNEFREVEQKIEKWYEKSIQYVEKLTPKELNISFNHKDENRR